jgi:hydroxymethylpyrimidine pyrophosphatase-like HAD family hydrolase
MRYLALIADYDGTLATHGTIPDEAVRALERLKESGRRTILLTGRRLNDLFRVCPFERLFDFIVAENGAVVYNPRTRTARSLANPPAKYLVQTLQERGVDPIELGEVIVATFEPHRRTVQEVLHELGLEDQVISNREAVMILPAGVNKASGLDYALRALGLSRHEVVGVGDAENDHSFLARCECSVAVANAIPSLRNSVSFVTKKENGAGVAELIDELIATDLRRRERGLQQHFIPLGTHCSGEPVSISPYGANVLIAGPSSSGKSTFAASLVERLIEKDYQVCIVDPEGDYGTLTDLVALGNRWREPSINEVLSVLEDSKVNLAINLLGIQLEDRPEFFGQLVPHLQAMRARTGRPHWFVVDEAHHMLPPTWGASSVTLPRTVGETIFITVHPDHVSPVILSQVDVVIAVGHSPEQTLGSFASATGRKIVWPEGLGYRADHAVVWFVTEEEAPCSIKLFRGHADQLRHRRKYAEGDLRWHSFYFRGPDEKLNLKAQNLAIFCQIAAGIDDETWMFHFRRGDYSRWFRYCIRDPFLANEVERMERREDLMPWQSRQTVRDLVNSRYTLPE